MPQSLAKIIVHIVFSTKDRKPVLKDVVRRKLYAFMVGILNTLGCITYVINGTEDHLHVLVSMSKNITLAKMLEEMKVGTSKWLKTQDISLQHFSWQSGYGAFSVSESQVPRVVQYIENQEQHHQKQTFQEELRIMLQKHNVEFNEQYLWS